MIIKEYLEPTTIFILGCYFYDKPKTVMITDDESSFEIKTNKSSYWLDSIGFIYILTEKELDEYLSDANTSKDLHNSSMPEYVKIENYVGKVILSVINSETDEVIEKDYDLEDYISFQTDQDEWCDIILLLDTDQEIKKKNTKTLVNGN